LTMKKKIKYEEMTPAELEEALRENPVVYVPTGLLEWHGDHLPLGLDALKMYGITLRIARKYGGVVLPLNYYGVRGFGSFHGTLVYSRKLVKNLFLELFAQLEKIGAKVIVLLTGHYGSYQVNLVKECAREFMKKSKVKVIAQPEYEDVYDDDGVQPADHAGKYETSFALALFPKLVRLDKFKKGICKIKRYKSSGLHPAEKAPWKWTYDMKKAASRELGREMMRRIVKKVGSKIEAARKELGV